MRLGDIVNAIESLQRLSNTGMKLQYAYNIHKMVGCFQQEIDFFNEKRQAIFEKYGEHTKEDIIEIPKNKQEVVSKEIAELLDVEVLENFQKLELPVSEDIRMTANDIIRLQSFIDFKEEIA